MADTDSDTMFLDRNDKDIALSTTMQLVKNQQQHYFDMKEFLTMAEEVLVWLRK